MAALPKTLTFTSAARRFRVIHGGVDLINRFVFASQRDVLAEELARAGADVVIAGHAGVPFIEKVGTRVWFNPGVIGMPANDGTADVWYGLIGPEGDSWCSRRTGSPTIICAAAAMRRTGHADGYARTLVTGLWPSLDVFPPAERAATGVSCASARFEFQGTARRWFPLPALPRPRGAWLRHDERDRVRADACSGACCRPHPDPHPILEEIERGRAVIPTARPSAPARSACACCPRRRAR